MKGVRTIIEENSNTEHTTVIIKCRETTDGIRKLAEYIEKYTQQVVVYKNNERFSILKTTVYYLETVDGKTFCYTENSVFEIRQSLDNAQKMFVENGFVRIRRNCAVNIHKIKCVKTYDNHRVMLELDNDEKIIASRRYIPELKEKLAEMG